MTGNVDTKSKNQMFLNDQGATHKAGATSTASLFTLGLKGS
jgi:hypothetical protein